MARLLATTVDGLHKAHTNKSTRIIGNNTFSRRERWSFDRTGFEGEIVYTITLHSSDIVKLQKGHIYVNLAGWDTVTTRERINQFLPGGWRMFREKKITYLAKRECSRWVMPESGWVKVDELTIANTMKGK